MSMPGILEELKKHRIVPALEGDQLLLTGQTEDLSPDLMEKVRADRQLLIEFLRESADHLTNPVIPSAPVRADYAVSAAQKRMWMMDRSASGSAAYTIMGAFYLEGSVNEGRLADAFGAVMQRHESLRTVFTEREWEVRQLVNEFPSVDLAMEDVRNSPDVAKKIETAISLAAGWTFDLESGPMVRARLYRVAQREYVLLVGGHHIVFDGWSMNVLMGDLLRIYHSPDGPEVPMQPLRIHYKDYCEWLTKKQTGARMMRGRDFWRHEFRSVPEPLNLQTAKPRPVRRSPEGASLKFHPGKRLLDQVFSLTKRSGATPFSFFRSALSILLYKYSGQIDHVIGVPASGRDNAELEDQIGLFVNTLPLRVCIDPGETFANLLQRVAAHTAAAMRFRDYPFDKIVEDNGTTWGTDRHPFFDVMLVCQQPAERYVAADPEAAGHLRVKMLSGQLPGFDDSYRDNAPAKLDLEFSVLMGPGETWSIEVIYSKRLFERADIGRMFNAWIVIMEQALEEPGRPVSAFDIVLPGDKELLHSFNDTEHEFEKNTTLFELFQQQVAKSPEKTVLVFNGGAMTYRQLDAESGRVAGKLSRLHGVRAGDVIAVRLERSEKLFVSILAILRLGGAYLPMDPEYPEERLAYMANDSQCRMVVTAALFDEFAQVPGSDKNVSGDGPTNPGQPNDLAYVIYTSGSTGKPKGCALEHRGVVNRLEWMWNEYGFTSEDIILQKTTFTFDVSVWEIFLPLCYGARMVLCSADDARSPEAIASLIEREKITCLHFVPSMLEAFMRDQWTKASIGNRLSTLTRVITSGEALAAKTLATWYDKTSIPIHNLYGPTEASVDVTYFDTRQADAVVPIGRPIWNTEIFILGVDDGLVPVGFIGEICLGGVGLARGYINRPELTSERFVPHFLAKGGRIYRTGDLGRWLSDGTIEYIGRKDTQVKIRGYRIEPGEVERSIGAYAGIKDVVVIAVENRTGEKELLAFIVAEAGLDLPALRAFLANLLPDYMIPSQYTLVDKIPLSANGKVDRRQLSVMEVTRSVLRASYAGARNGIELRLIALWEEVLDRRIGPGGGQQERIGIYDNFFDLGGHSLKLISLAARIRREFGVTINLKELFTHKILEEQSSLIAKSASAKLATIEPLEGRSRYTLSASQRRLWALSHLGEANVAYNMAGAFRLEGMVDLRAFDAAFSLLCRRHESLRTHFEADADGEIWQVVGGPESVGQVNYFDLRAEISPDEKVNAEVRREMLTPFDLSSGALIRLCVWRTGSDSYIISCVVHHIVCDGWSMRVLIEELLSFYNAWIVGETPVLTPLRLQYGHFAEWQKRLSLGNEMESHRRYWLDKFKGEIPVLALIGDHPRPPVKTYRGAMVRKRLSEQLCLDFRQLLKKSDKTLFMGLVAAVTALLSRYTGQTDIIIGTPIAGRDQEDLEDQIGLYANTLPLRMRFDAAKGFEDMLAVVQEAAIGAYEHQIYPLDELVRELDARMDMSRNPLFEVEVLLQPFDIHREIEKAGMWGVNIKPFESAASVTSRFDLVFEFLEDENEIVADLTFNCDIYESRTAARFLDHLSQLLSLLIAESGVPISTIDYLTAAEKRQMTVDFNATDREFIQKGMTLVELFETTADQMPSAIAVDDGYQRLDFDILNKKANNLAAELRRQFKVGANEIVAVLLSRSADLPIAILGILKSGAAYVPIDPALPAARKKFILEDTAARVLITASDFLLDLDFFSGEVFAIDIQLNVTGQAPEPAPASIKGDDLAYVIYTSGSTGQPKGVMIQHAAIANTILSQREIFDVGVGGHHLQFASASFDASVSEIFVSLISGGTLYIIDENKKGDAAYFEQYLADNQIDIATIPPAYLKQLDMAKLPPLAKLVTAGEAAAAEKVNAYREFGTYFNAYGPTECSICATIYRPRGKDGMSDKNIPIGRPIANCKLFILDDSLNLVPLGVAGELFIVGAGIAKGYLNRPDLTADRFIRHPLAPGAMLYRSGDLGRWLPDGNVEFLGRKDDQLKIRGYRIEPGEIEDAVQQLPGIDAAVVVAVEGKETGKELAVYFAAGGLISAASLRAALGKMLPAYMVPAYFVQLERIPLNQSGKVDRKALPDAVDSGLNAGPEHIAPRTQKEERLVAIWKEVLEREGVSAKDNFFDIGGHSLRATRLVSLIHREFDIKLDLRDIFSAPVLEDQAALIGAAVGARFVSIPLVESTDGYDLSSAQKRLWRICQVEETGLAYHVPVVYRFRGALDFGSLEEAFAEVIRRHEILRTVFVEDAQEEVKQFVLPAGERPFSIEYTDLRIDPKKETTAREMVRRDLAMPFVLAEGNLMRAFLYQVEEDEWIFSFVMHHIISDGWSVGQLVKEILLLYPGFQTGEPVSLTPLGIQYKDYAHWQRGRMNEPSMEAHKTYWMNKFNQQPNPLTLIGSKRRPAMKTYAADSVQSTLDANVCRSIRQLSAENGGTLFMTLIAALNALLFCYSDEEEFVIGSPVAGRQHADLDEQIGFYINTIALRTRLSAEEEFSDVLARVRETTLEAYEHQDYPFDELVDALDIRWEKSRNALFDVWAVLHNTEINSIEDLKVPGLKIVPYEGWDELRVKVDLLFRFIGEEDQLSVGVEFNIDLFDKATAENLCTDLGGVLSHVAVTPNATLAEIREQLNKQKESRAEVRSQKMRERNRQRLKNHTK